MTRTRTRNALLLAALAALAALVAAGCGGSLTPPAAVEGGLPADVGEFSLEPDIPRLVEAGLVDEDWNQNEYDGMVTDSVVVFMVRKGNPENIRTWDDLIKPGIEVIEPNPFTSGGAKSVEPRRPPAGPRGRGGAPRGPPPPPPAFRSPRAATTPEAAPPPPRFP